MGTAETFVLTWAEEVRRQVTRVHEIREKAEVDLRAAEYNEDWSPTDPQLEANFRQLWAAQHQLIWAAHQLERWSRRLARETR